MTGGTCGQCAVLHGPGTSGYLSGPCILPTGHGAEHRDRHGDTWTESTR